MPPPAGPTWNSGANPTGWNSGGSPTPAFSGSPYAPADLNNSRLPSGLINRTGASLDGTPSLPGAGAAVPDAAGAAADFADGYYPNHMADGKMGGGFHWYEPRLRFNEPKAPSGGYTPLNNRPKPMLADGYRARPRMMADGDAPMDLSEPIPQAPQVAGPGLRPAQIITKPTRVRLSPHEAVIPLTHRPKAKVRPSAMLAGGYYGGH